jgi:amylosucrase
MPSPTQASELFELRAQRSAADLWPMLSQIYGAHPDFAAMQAALQEEMARAAKARPADLKRLDLQRDLEPDWFQRPEMVGYAAYADRFTGSIAAIEGKLDYLTDLGVRYLHVMPCLKPRPAPNDGGYSVQDYRKINPDLGSMADLERLARAMRGRGMSLCIDLVLNHTAREHEWAQKALAGDPFYQDFYYFFDDDTLPRQYEEHLVEIFPNDAPGSFTYVPELGKWVWTTFHVHQWDLNWSNPWVFLEIAKVMLFLANKGVDVLRLDAVAFMWKRMGTRCQSEPEVHMLLRALRAVCRITCPGVLHLEEAITAPAEMLTYLGRGDHDGKIGNLAYHNTLMVQYWSALASRDTRLMAHVLATHFPETLTNATYATYLRCHDDIGWAVTDEDAGDLGFSGRAHRAFLSDFYDGSFAGSFARGALFQENPATGDKRISGTLASLTGVEKGLAEGDARAVDLAVQRILMGTALIASYGGVPLIYMGDEVALTNDYGYLDVPEHATDSRWIHRPRMDWDRVAHAADGDGVAGQVLAGTRAILHARARLPALHGAVPTRILRPDNAQVLAFARLAPTGTVLCLFNFSEAVQTIPESWLRAHGATRMHDLLSGYDVQLHDGRLVLLPYGRVWLG